MQEADATSLLEYALLGLIRQGPASGYSLRKVFADTAMGSFSDSPGAIYPALKRLERRGLIAGAVEKSAGLRSRKVFRLTAKGSTNLNGWIRQPLASDEVVRGLGGILLRFAFSDPIADPESTRQLLQSLHSQLSDYVQSLEGYAASHAETMPLAGRLALDHGIRGYRSSLEWTVMAMDACQSAQSVFKANYPKSK
jgi:DNA-binding PadR family transcriptional regulator